MLPDRNIAVNFASIATTWAGNLHYHFSLLTPFYFEDPPPSAQDRRMVHLASLRACALSRHRRKQKTETSSDASDVAPERARKDATKEVKLHCEGSHPSFASFRWSFSGFHPTLPMSAENGVRGAPALPFGHAGCATLPGGALGDRALPVPCAGNLFRFGDPGLRPSCRFHDIISYLNIARLLNRV